MELDEIDQILDDVLDTLEIIEKEKIIKKEEPKGNPVKELIINPFGKESKKLTFLLHMDGSRSFTAKLTGNIHPVRVYYNDIDNHIHIMPYNGPKLEEGATIKHHRNYIIKKINYSTEKELYIIDIEFKELKNEPELELE